MSEGQPWGRSAELRTEVGLSGGQGRVMCMEGAGGAEGQTQGVGWSQGPWGVWPPLSLAGAARQVGSGL